MKIHKPACVSQDGNIPTMCAYFPVTVFSTLLVLTVMVAANARAATGGIVLFSSVLAKPALPILQLDSEWVSECH